MKEFVTILKALADDSRLKILELLLTHDLCVGALAYRLGISKAAISQHLQVLRKAGIVKGEKRGYWTHYAVERSVLHQIADELIKKANKAACPGGTCLRKSSIEADFGEWNEKEMCKDCFDHPEKLKRRSKDYKPVPIKDCHSNTKAHPC